MKRFMVLLLLLSIVMTGCSVQDKESSSKKAAEVSSTKETVITEDLSSYFEGYDACFVLYDQNKNTYTIYNQDKSQKRIAPCSTFKIVNSLIGLETKVVEDENTIFKWNGYVYPYKEMNQDQTLATAIQRSAFWCYQEIAAKVGPDRMQSFINDLDYGNKDISGGIDQFWQQSSLQISPIEQIGILKKIYNNQSPFTKRSTDILKKILILSNENGVVLSGKTGSGLQRSSFIKEAGDEFVIGWFVGYVEKDNNVYYFATNIEAAKDATGTKAKEKTLEILKSKQLY